jgi:hypothetical protein
MSKMETPLSETDSHVWDAAYRIMVGIALLATLVVVIGTLQVQYGNRKQGYYNRAVSCRLLINTGDELPASCKDPHVVKLFSATNPTRNQKETALVCRLLQDLKDPAGFQPTCQRAIADLSNQGG